MGELPFPVRAGEFEGPLDLLLALVRSHAVPLDQVPLSAITGQYLSYMKEAETCQVDLGAEFIYMAATLIHIKSRMLLPVDPALSARNAPDPGKELIDRIREHAAAKEFAQVLKSRGEVEQCSWSRPGLAEFLDTADPTPSGALSAGSSRASLADLIDTLSSAVARARTQSRLTVDSDGVTMEERLDWFRRQVSAGAAIRQPFTMLASGEPLLRAICLFLALLELARLGEVTLDQAGEDLWVDPGQPIPPLHRA